MLKQKSSRGLLKVRFHATVKVMAVKVTIRGFITSPRGFKHRFGVFPKNRNISCSQRSTALTKLSNSSKTAAATRRTHRIKVLRNSYAAVTNKRSRRCWNSADSSTLSRYTCDSSMGKMKAIKRCSRTRSVFLRMQIHGTRPLVGSWTLSKGKPFVRDSTPPYLVRGYFLYLSNVQVGALRFEP